MFSALNQGSLVHIIDKSDGLKYKVGEVIGQTTNNMFGNIGSPSFSNLSATVTLKVKVDGNVVEYPEIPSNSSVASYNNGNVILLDSKEGVMAQVESIVQNSRKMISDEYIAIQKKNIADGEEILKSVNPQFAKDKERDDRINNLDSKITGMEGKLDKILNALSNSSSNNLKI